MEKFFQIKQRGSSIFRECIAGMVTFATMSYIMMVQPSIMTGQAVGMNTGMDATALITTTCLVSAFGCILMGILSNYPIGLAPGMGLNFFLVLSIIPVCATTLNQPIGSTAVWRLALGVVFCSGLLFFLLSFGNLRKALLNSVSPGVKNSIAVGIGIFIALLGLKNAGIVIPMPNGLGLGDLTSNESMVFCTGLILMTVLSFRRVPGSVLIGICGTACLATALGMIKISAFFGLPASPMSVMFKMDITGVCDHLYTLIPFVLMLTFMDIFDTLGTTIGVGTQAGFIQNGEFPKVERVFIADATATLVGGAMGHSNVTSFVESIAGVEAGGRTGLTAITTGVLFLLAIFCTPFIFAVSGCLPITSSALFFVGLMMMRNVTEIAWDDLCEAVPAFAIIVSIPFFSNIADGMMVGFILYPVISLLCGRWRIGWTPYLLAAILTLYIVFIK